ncbi:coth protein-domain-containing protein [Zychaea mexicana]|uniref:coth protein-domain-containing protein n=1 Tax=Zychaea mexicana TaxID=64656 RepID=UPI0022FDF742|nr:coth protein-domain-containing protein [Zychaea mexicana]KAI9479622.1 coth protein-domain-containing protein [Zychaea mexicana]
MAVVVDDKSYPLSVTPESSILHTGSAPTAQKGYYYAMISKKETDQQQQQQRDVIEHEPFVRQPADAGDTPNEFYNRSKNAYDITSIPQVLDPLPYIHRMQSNLHRPGKIATVHIVGPQDEIDRMHRKSKDDIQVMTNVTYISIDDVQTFTGVEFEISGRFSREAAKSSYNLKIPKKQDLYGYRRLKLRSLATDPSYIREDLGYKMLAAAGVTTTYSSYVRLFINSEPIGLFGFIENFKNPWLRNEFNDGTKKGYDQGHLYQGKFTNAKAKILGNRVSDLSYEGEEEWKYSLGQYKIKEDPSVGEPSYKPLIALTKFISEAPTTNATQAIIEWNKHFDMESVLRGLALEMVMGFGDGYLAMADNFYLYQESSSSERYIFIISDIDISMGSNNLIAQSKITTGDWHKFAGDITKRPLMAKLLAVPEFVQRFDELIKDLGDRLLDPNMLSRTIDETVAMISEDVAWDKSCKRLSKAAIISQVNLAVFAKAFGLLKGYAVDDDTVHDFRDRSKRDVPFQKAIDGSTGHISLTGVKEFITQKNKAIADYYNSTQAS